VRSTQDDEKLYSVVRATPRLAHRMKNIKILNIRQRAHGNVIEKTMRGEP